MDKEVKYYSDYPEPAKVDKIFNYCVAGNIVKSHTDGNGILRYGTSAYAGGTKVLLLGKPWTCEQTEICVIGLTRGKRYECHDVPVELIENVRLSKVYTPSVLEIMNDPEFCHCWWHGTPEDRKDAKRFLELWNNAAIIHKPE